MLSMMIPPAKDKSSLCSRLFIRVPSDLKAQFNESLLRTNVNRMFVFSIYVIGIQILLNLINILIPNSEQADNIMVYVMLSLGTLTIGVVYWFLLLMVRRDRIKNQNVKIFLVNSLLYVYMAIQMVFCTLNIFSNGGINSYIIAIMILGLFPILPPKKSLLSIGAICAYLLTVMYINRDVSVLWNSILLTDNWTNLIIITGITMCISMLIYQMYVSSFLQSVRLEQYNKELIGINNELAEVNDRLEILANTDQMTGVANRHAFSREFNDIWRETTRKRNIAVAIVDIDFFKDYNDKFGHMEGDKCLQLIANSLRKSFSRSNDIVARYGGEEFMIVFEADRAEALEMVERAKNNVEALHIPHANNTVSPYVTISAGVCTVVPSTHNSNDRVLQIADEALYESKNSGRNRTTIRDYYPLGE